MNIKPVVYITTHESLNAFKTALLSCADIGQFACDKKKDILPLSMRADQVYFAVKEIVHNLKQTENDVLVDADALQNALALFNIAPNRKAWGITDNMMNRIYEVVYDPKSPHRAEIVQGITEALRLQDLYSRTKESNESGDPFSL